ncbi:MAG: PhoH family protein [Candidatus Electryoneaceae bacterium]|nr:PhoH family protein [Candidatus Electryoneaceae bacterium]
MDEKQCQIAIDGDIFPHLLGVGDVNLRYIEKHIQSRLSARSERIMVSGPAYEQEKIKRVFIDLVALHRNRSEVTMKDIATILRLAGINGSEIQKFNGDTVILETPRGSIRPRNANQAHYVRLMVKSPISFALGPAGTGKTYLAVAMAIDHYQRRVVDKIILTRPVVESGETLGFLPGDILEKVDPYFRPLYDALDEMLSRDKVSRLIEKGVIEIAPLAYMRGRTLNHAFVILDEAQNTTSGQMKMFLTRLGGTSRAVLTGDPTQIDLHDPSTSGLMEANELLQGIDGISFIHFSDRDVVRHRLVVDILRAYQNNGDSTDE